MGPQQSNPLHVRATQKEITVFLPAKSIKVLITQNIQTMSQLVAKINDQCVSRYPIITLKSLKRQEILDYWLSLPEKSVSVLDSSDELIAVFYSPVPRKICCSSFEIIKVIGRGAYSIVTLVRKKDTGIIYAMKTIIKENALRESSVYQILAEKEILASISHSFVAKMHWAFHTPKKVHIVMDYYPGGELFYHLRRFKRFTEPQAQFYFAEVLLVLQYLHSKKIAYRDLKPENIVIDIDGHIKVTDFGLSKKDMNDISHSFCGSPEYMSPEMLKGHGHTKIVDFYCLGALLFEMLTGHPPFYDRDKQKMYQKILNSPLAIPEYLSGAAVGLLTRLLEKDPLKRLGRKYGAIEIMNHAWCKEIDFEKVMGKAMIPPFVPDLRKSNIDKVYNEFKIDMKDYSDSEVPEGDIFESVEFNVHPKNNSISQHYFEESTKYRSESAENRKIRKIYRLKADDDSFKACVSMRNFPDSSPEHDYRKSELTETDFKSRFNMYGDDFFVKKY